MMQKSKSSVWMRSKVLYIIPMATLALSAFATSESLFPSGNVLPIANAMLLSTNEQKEIVGGDLILEGCAHKTHEQCSGACILDGYEGYATSEA